jgi:serine/threonine protein kinase
MSSTPPNDQFRLVGTRLDDYDVERVVAAGGFGIVYFARHHALGRSVAIKVLKGG